MTTNLIETVIKDYEYDLAKYKFVQEKFPGCKVSNTWLPITFSSKLVNSSYTNFSFDNRYNHVLYIEPYTELEFTYNGEVEFIKVYSSPRRNRLAYVHYMRDPNSPKDKIKLIKVVKLSRFRFNMKNNQFKEDAFNSCRVEIMKFIKNHPDHELDAKYLDPSLKKLLAFV